MEGVAWSQFEYCHGNTEVFLPVFSVNSVSPWQKKNDITIVC